ncbi:hypothetical protein M8R20_18845 [Pseudomonas sp. R2.Fl]|nr:hypothetical protein [Pseudomonas sp. R2.Fl]
MTRERLFALREAVARIEGKPAQAAREAALRGGEAILASDRAPQAPEPLPMLMDELAQAGSFVEIRSERLADAGAASGLALALACSLHKGAGRRVLLIGDREVAREAGLPYAPGLDDFGCRPGELVHALPRRIEDVLWLAGEALSCRAFSAVLFEMRGNVRRFGLTESRRLSLKARDAGGTLLLIRQAGEEEASSASLRVKVGPEPAAMRAGPEPDGIGRPVFRVTVEKSRSAVFSDFLLEWNSHERRLVPCPPASRRSPHPVAQLPAAFHGQDREAQMGALLALDRAS